MDKAKFYKPSKPVNGGMAALAEDIARMSEASNGFVLEIGVFTGTGSTVAMQDGLERHANPLHISVDWQDIIESEYRPSVPWWHMVVGDSRSVETRERVCRIAGERKAGLIFIDTDHNFEQLRQELVLWSALASDEAVWLFHDTHMYGTPNLQMVRAVIEFADKNGWTYEDYRQDSHGLGRMTR